MSAQKKTNNYDLIEKSMNLSLYWADRSKKAFGVNRHKALFGIVQGGLFKDLRIKSLKELMHSIRDNIKKGTFLKFHDKYIDIL